jgi:hypothetical protein
MRSRVIGKLSLGIASIFLIGLVQTVSGQTCSNDAGELHCGSPYWACTTLPSGKFSGNCQVEPNEELLREGDEKAFDADYNNRVTGETRSAEEVANDETRQKELRAGRIVKPDGTVITFPPINTVKERIRLSVRPGFLSQPLLLDESQLEARFEKVRETEGIDRAIDRYRCVTAKNPFFIIKTSKTRTRYFENLGEKLLQSKSYLDAIKVFQFNVEMHPDSGMAYFKLADAQQTRFTFEPSAEDKENAIKNYELVLTSKTANRALRNRAIERLRVLKP